MEFELEKPIVYGLLEKIVTICYYKKNTKKLQVNILIVNL